MERLSCPWRDQHKQEEDVASVPSLIGWQRLKGSKDATENEHTAVTDGNKSEDNNQSIGDGFSENGDEHSESAASDESLPRMVMPCVIVPRPVRDGSPFAVATAYHRDTEDTKDVSGVDDETSRLFPDKKTKCFQISVLLISSYASFRF
ncbi:hypothetical protein R1sor_020692 [Riccia sorocarpa]|uniref:Uncharacterized protein n=1 Tax=Riccia sorocarpa TaxID=122646 RepID=A0ABD3GGD2_9MARC